MKILELVHIYPPSRIGGIEKIAQLINESVNCKDIDIEVLTCNLSYTNENKTSRVLNDINVNIVEVSKNYKFPNSFITEHLFANTELIIKGIEILKKNRFDYIYAHDWFVSIAAIKLSKMFDIPIISTFHYSKLEEMKGRESENGQFIVQLQDELFENSVLVLLYSKKLIKEFLEQGKSKNKIYYIPLPIENIKKFSMKNYRDRENRIIFIGRLSKEKNVKTVLEVMKKYNLKVGLDILGDGYLYDELKNYVVENNLDVKFHGFVKDEEIVNSYISNSKALILPSDYDCFGLVILEAIKNGTPVIISEGVGAKYLTPLLNKYTFKHGDLKSIRNIIEAFLQNSEEVILDFLSIQNQVSLTNNPMQTFLKFQDTVNQNK